MTMSQNVATGAPARDLNTLHDFMKRVWDTLCKISGSFWGILCRGVRWLKRIVIIAINGKKTEEKKPVIRTEWRRVAGHLGVHLLPFFAVITLSYFNMAGYFIGSTLEGHPDETSQGVSRLALQVTAKLIVGFISFRYYF